MTTLAAGSSVTLIPGDGGSVTASSNWGEFTVTETPIAGVVKTSSYGPRPVRVTFGPYKEGATVVIASSNAVVDYETNGNTPADKMTAAEVAATQALVSGGGIVPVSASGDTTGATDRAAIQAALNAAGEILLIGNHVINATLVIKSFTRLRLAPTATLRLASGVQTVMLVNEQYLATRATVSSLVWDTVGPGITCTTAAPHGYAVGDWISVHGAAQRGFNVVAQVKTVVSSTAFTYQAVVTPITTTATVASRYSAITVSRADREIYFCGGTWDWNNSGALLDTPLGNCINLAHVVGYGLEKTLFKNVNTRCFFVYSARSGALRDNVCDKTAVMLQTNGPITNLTIDNTTSAGTDDAICIMGREATGFAAQALSEGDVVNVSVTRTTTHNTGRAVRVLNGGGLHWMDGIEVDGVDGYSPEEACTVEGDVPGSATGLFGRVTFRNINSVCYYRKLRVDRATVQTLVAEGIPLKTLNTTFGEFTPVVVQNSTIQNMRVSGLYTLEQWTPNAASYGVRVASTATVFDLEIDGSELNATGNATMLQNDGAVSSCLLRSCKAQGGARIYSANGTLNVLNISACEVRDSTNSLSLNLVGVVNFNGYRTSGGTNAMQVVSSVTITGGGFSFNGMTPVTVSSGTPTVKSFELPVDIGASGVSKTISGQFAYNTGSARGTVAQNRLVTCNGTNWVQVDTPANVF